MALNVAIMVAGARRWERLTNRSSAGISTTSQPPLGGLQRTVPKTKKLSSEQQLCGTKGLVDVQGSEVRMGSLVGH